MSKEFYTKDWLDIEKFTQSSKIDWDLWFMLVVGSISVALGMFLGGLLITHVILEMSHIWLL